HLSIEAYALDVLIARQHPRFQLRAPVRRVLVAKTLIERERVGQELRVARPELNGHRRSIAGQGRQPVRRLTVSAPSQNGLVRRTIALSPLLLRTKFLTFDLPGLKLALLHRTKP